MTRPRPKRVHARYNYHDGDIVSLVWTKPDELVVSVRLDSCGECPAPDVARLYFTGVLNRPEIEARWTDLQRQESPLSRTIDGFFTTGRGEYDLGPLHVRSQSIFEV